MKRFFHLSLPLVLCVSVAALFALSACSFPGYQTTTIDNLRTRLNDPAVTIIDVRQDRDWKKSEWKIKGAVRENPNRVAAWAGNYSKENTIVVY